ncbi:MAG: urea transport system permease protein, partial [Paracoccaceae bacterium]
MRLIAGFLLVLTLTLAAPAIAQDFETLVAQLPDGEFEDTSRLVDQIAATGHPRAATVLEALSGGFLAAMREDGRMVILRGEGRTKTAYDAFTDEEIGEVGRRDTAAIGVNNGLRRDIAAAVGRMGLQNPDPTIRRAAALAAFDARNPSRIEAL